MNLVKKITQIFFLIFLASFLASCEEGCVEADEFDTINLTIESNPTNDGVSGNYDAVDGGQNAQWHETGLRSNGDQFVIQFYGSWTPWNGDELTDAAMTNLPRCNFCAKKASPPSPNCICYKNQTPAIETNTSGEPISTDSTYCNNTVNQNNPVACTCTKDPQYGTSADYLTYHFPLNFYNKDETPKTADNQAACKLDQGIGLYVGLFGTRGTDVPVRLYQMFSEEAVCNVRRNANNQCLDENGIDVTRYVYRSANDRIFMKDDMNGNTDNNTDTSNDVYYGPNEYLKLKIYDSYYSDNFGRYYISILKGVGDTADSGLLEFLVSMVESILLGPEGSDGQREGGIIEFMYKAVVQDTSFIIALQVALSIYIAVYGAAYLYGLVEMDRKEIMGRTLKIGLILLFTSSSSWTLYNTIVVAFFKDSMDYVVAMVMSLSDANQDPSSMIIISQMEQANDASNATRFSYVDLTIKKLFANNTAKKIFGLFFGTYYGVLLIPCIYALIGFFLYVMLMVASIYMINVMKIVFVLSLGPIFMCFSLFTHTSSMFKNWLGFVAARSLEIIMLFAVLYNFLILIDEGFTDLLYYRACREGYDFGLFTINILKSYISDRSLMVWIVDLVSLGGLIFITLLVVEKVGDLAGSLISVNIGGTSSKGGASSFKMAGDAMKGAFGLAMQAASVGLNAGATAGAYAIKGGTEVARATGIAGALARATDSIPISSPRSMYRNNFIDSAISKAQAEAKSKGLTGKEADQFVRNSVNENMQNLMMRPDQGSNPQISESKPFRAALAGIDMKTVADRLDKKLVQDPLKQFIKDEAKKLKNADSDKILDAKAMRAELRNKAESWAEKNLSIGSERVASLVAKREGESKSQMNAIEREIKGLLKKESELTPVEAAKRFAGNPERQNQYLQSLKDKEFKQSMKNEAAFKTDGSRIGALLKAPAMASNLLGRGYNAVMRDNYSNPKIAQESFARNLRNEERGGLYKVTDPLFYNPLNRSNTATKVADFVGSKMGLSKDSNSMAARAEEAEKKALLSYLATSAQDPKKSAPTTSTKSMNAADKQAKEDRNKAKEDQKRQFYQNQLRKMATKDLAKEAFQIGKMERRGETAKAEFRKQQLLEKEKANLAKDDKSLFEKAARMDYLSQKMGIGGGPTDPNRVDFQSALAKAHSEKVNAEANRVQAAMEAAAKANDAKKLEAAKAEAAKLKDLNAGLFTTGQKLDLKSSDPLAKAFNGQMKKVENGMKANAAKVTSGATNKATKAQIIAARNRNIFDRKALAAERSARAETANTVHSEQMKSQERMDLLNKNIAKEGERIAKEAEFEKTQKENRQKLMKEMSDIAQRKNANQKKALEAKAKEVEDEQKRKAAETAKEKLAERDAKSPAKLSKEDEEKFLKEAEKKALAAEKEKAQRDALLKMTEDQRKEFLKESEKKLLEEEAKRKALKDLGEAEKLAAAEKEKAAAVLKALDKLTLEEKENALKALKTLADANKLDKDKKEAEALLKALEAAGKLSDEDKKKVVDALKASMEAEKVAAVEKEKAAKALEKLSAEEKEKALNALKVLADATKSELEKQAATAALKAIEDAAKEKAANLAKETLEAEKLATAKKEEAAKALEKLSAEEKANALNAMKTLAESSKSEAEKQAAAAVLKALEEEKKLSEISRKIAEEALKAAAEADKLAAAKKEEALKATENAKKLVEDQALALKALTNSMNAEKLAADEKAKAETILKALTLAEIDKEKALAALKTLAEADKPAKEKQDAALAVQALVDAGKLSELEKENILKALTASAEAEKAVATEKEKVAALAKALEDAKKALDEDRAKTLKSLADADKLSAAEKDKVAKDVLAKMSDEQKEKLAKIGLEKMVADDNLNKAVEKKLEEEKRKAAEMKASELLAAAEEKRKKDLEAAKNMPEGEAKDKALAAAREKTPEEKKKDLKEETNKVLENDKKTNLTNAIAALTSDPKDEALKAARDEALKAAAEKFLAEEKKKALEAAGTKLSEEDVKKLFKDPLAGMTEDAKNKALEDAKANLTKEQTAAALKPIAEKMLEDQKKLEVKNEVNKMTPEEKTKTLDTAVGAELASSVKKVIGEMMAAGEEKKAQTDSNRIDSAVGGSALSNSEFSKKVDYMTPAEFAKSKERLDVIVTDFKIEFGGSVADLMMKGFDVGLKASNILPGGDAKAGTRDEALIASLKTAKTQMDMKYKMAKMDMKMAQFELDRASGKSKEEIAALQKKADDAEKEFGSISANCDKLDKQLEISMKG